MVLRAAAACLVSLPILLFAACGASPAPEHAAPTPPVTVAKTPFVAPPTRQTDTVDDYFGEPVRDPYRWLEDQDGAEVATWVAAQNAATEQYLSGVSQRPALRARLQALWNQPRYGLPRRAGEHWIYSKNDGLQNQSVYYLTDDPQHQGKLLLDPNTMSADGTVALAGMEPDEQGHLLAYATSARGSDWREWHVLDLRTGEVQSDRLQWSKFSGAAWTKDSQGFFYVRYPEPKPGQVYQAATTNPQLCYHRLGDEQAKDRVVYERPDQPDWGFGGQVTDDGRFLVIRLSAGTDVRNRVAYVDLLEADWPVRPLLMDLDAGYSFLGNDGDTFWFSTDKDAEHRRIVAIDRKAPATGWRTLVVEREQTLQSVTVAGDRFVCLYLADASSQLQVFKLDGTHETEIPLPMLGTVAGISGKRSDSRLYFGFTACLIPPSVLQYDLPKKELTTLRTTEVAFDFAPYVTERRFLQSKDGTRLCVFITHRSDLRLDGSHRTLLYGYGGFDIAMTPSFSVPNLVWLEQGGITATAVLRGGGEYGKLWHQRGMLANKQNVFDDFLACAEFLVRNGYTRKERLAIHGGSNGGLLVGACLVQHPEMFGAAVPEVGVLDMLRYQKFTIGRAWASEYGTSEDKAQYGWLRAYSPLHNIKPGAVYPATLVMTGDHDDRVLPGHSYKFGATLQAAQAGEAPILLRVGTNAGHGGGKPVQKQIDEAADRLAFLWHALGGDPPAATK